MKRHLLVSGAFVFLTAASLASIAPSHAETTQCTVITSVPFTISVPGIYCLKTVIGTAMTSGNAITINANNVVIDFNNFRLGGSSAGPTSTAKGVYASDRQNITIRNGVIRGFESGLHLGGASSSGHVIEDNLVDGATKFGIFAQGSSVTIRRNRIVNTNSTPPSAPASMASSASSSRRGFTKRSGQLSNQQVPQVAAGGAANGIRALSFQNGQITDNFISGTVSSASDANGISVTGSNIEVSRNTVLETRAYSFSAGILTESPASDVAVAKDNVVKVGTSTTATAIGIENIGGVLLCLNNVATGFAQGPTGDCNAQQGTFP